MILDKDLRALLEGTLEWGAKTKSILEIGNKEKFKADIVFQLAIVACAQHIGEKCAQILKKFPELGPSNPSIHFEKARALRNRIVHDYDGVDLDTIWDTVNLSIPGLMLEIEKLLDHDRSV